MYYYTLSYIICSLIVWLILHDYKTEYMTQTQADEELLFLYNAILFAPLTLVCIIYIAAELGCIAVIKKCKGVLQYALVTIALLTLTGCAGYKVDADGNVSTYGILRTLTVRKEYHSNGKLKSNTISTDSTTKDALLGLNELLDTAVDTAAKLKP